jgi:hypothetical protein
MNKKEKMKTLFNTMITGMALAILLFSCKKEGKQGPQGPQGPAGNPGEVVGSGEPGEVRAYIFKKPLVWQYHVSGGSAWLVENGFTREPQDYEFLFEEGVVNGEDVVLTYLELTSGSNAFSTQLTYTFQVPATTRLESYRVVHYESFREGYYFKIRGDVISTTTPYYQVKSLRVIVIPPANTGSVGGRYAQSLQQLSLAEVMEKYHLKDSDFKTFGK